MTGIHQITAIAMIPQRTIDFYTKVMGLRLVKLTVNFDDSRTYHFLLWDRDRDSTGHRQRAGGCPLRLPPMARCILESAPVEGRADQGPESRRFGERVLRFQDPDGLRRFAETGASGTRAWCGRVARSPPRTPCPDFIVRPVRGHCT